MTHRLPLLLALLGGLVVPAAAHAGTAEVRDGKLTYTARNAEVNIVDVRVGPAGKLIVADSAPQLAGAGCLLNGSGDLECDAAGVTSIELTLADRNDVVRYRAPHPGTVNAGIGTDTFFGGLRQAPTGKVSYLGGDGLADALRYTEADRGVTASLGSGIANDGRPGDLEDARGDIEVLEGSPFDDTLIGTDEPLGELFLGGNGIDKIDARGGPDRIDERTDRNGADTIDGGEGRDIIDYSRRSTPTRVSLDDVANDGDGAVPEGDNVKPTVEDIITGRGADVVVGSLDGNDIRTGSGDDRITGSQLSFDPDRGGDTIEPGAGKDRAFGSDTGDVFFTRDGETDDVACKGGLDFATTDPVANPNIVPTEPGTDEVNSCEATDAPVGALRLDASAGRIALSWRHPKAWRKLRAITVHVKHDGMEVGEIAIRPRAGRVTADGAVRLARSHLTRTGRTVTAQLALRLDDRLAGERLAFDVEATDRRGRRQLERG